MLVPFLGCLPFDGFVKVDPVGDQNYKNQTEYYPDRDGFEGCHLLVPFLGSDIIRLGLRWQLLFWLVPFLQRQRGFVPGCDMLEKFLSSFDWSTSTKNRYRSVLQRFLGDFPDPAAIDASDLLSWLGGQSSWGSTSRFVALSAIRSFLRWRFGSNHPALAARVKRRNTPRQRSLEVDQVLALLASFNTTKAKGRRDLAMAAIMLDSGLRVSELCRLSLRYLDLDRCSFQVIVKGGNWGSGVFSAYTANYVLSWLADRDLIAAAGVSSVFVNVRSGAALTRRGVGRIVSAWGERSGIGALSPHDLRRSFATLSTRFGAPARVLQLAGRWKSPEMIERYTPGIRQDDFRSYFPIRGVLES